MAGVFQRREVTMASILAGSIAVPAGFLFAGILRSCSPLSAGAVLFLPHLIRSAMKVHTEAVLDAFAKKGRSGRSSGRSSSPLPASSWRWWWTRQPGGKIVEALVGIVP
jgi:hypothetical protein